MTRRRAAGGVLAMGMVLGLVGVVPVVADAATRTTADSGPTTAAAVPGSTTELPFDSGPLVLLLVAVGTGTMGLLSREPAPARHPERG